MKQLSSVSPSTRSISGLQLAKKLGLSHATVSFVLNGIGEKRKISKETIDRVLAAAKRYNYAPNRFARSLKSQRSGMISVILPNFKMDWAEHVTTGMRKVFDHSELIPFVSTHSFQEDRNRRELLSFLERRDDGLITMPTMGCVELYREIAKTPLPVVFLGDEIPELTPLISSVMWDPRDAIRAAIAHNEIVSEQDRPRAKTAPMPFLRSTTAWPCPRSRPLNPAACACRRMWRLSAWATSRTPRSASPPFPNRSSRWGKWPPDSSSISSRSGSSRRSTSPSRPANSSPAAPRAPSVEAAASGEPNAP